MRLNYWLEPFNFLSCQYISLMAAPSLQDKQTAEDSCLKVNKQITLALVSDSKHLILVGESLIERIKPSITSLAVAASAERGDLPPLPPEPSSLFQAN